MIRVTFEEAAAFAQPDGLPRREADLFWRAVRLIRRAAGKGRDPDALIATVPEDLLPGSAFMTQIGLDGCPAKTLLDRASRVRYSLRLHSYEVDVNSPQIIALLPRDVLTDELRDALRLGYAPSIAVPHAALREELDALRSQGARVQWTRVRHDAVRDSPGFTLRVRVCGGGASREFRTCLPCAAFPDGNAVTAFINEAIGEGTYHI